MNRDRVRALLHAVWQGELDPEAALESFARLEGWWSGRERVDVAAHRGQQLAALEVAVIDEDLAHAAAGVAH